MLYYLYRVEGDTINISLKSCIKNMDKVLLVITVVLFLIGMFNIVNASSFEVNAGGELYYYFKKHIINLVSGFVIALVIFCFHTKYYKPLSFLAYLLALGLVAACFTQEAERGAQNWLALGPLTFQPSEFAKPVIIVCLGCLLSKWDIMIEKNEKINWLKEVIVFALISFPIPVMVIMQNDLGSASIILGIECVMFFASKIPKKVKKGVSILIAVIIMLVGLSVVFNMGIVKQYQIDRFKSIFTPCKDYTNYGYQTCNALIALNQGGLGGLGIGKSKQKYSYIPEPHTDSVFAIIGEELGFFISTFLIIMLFCVIARINKISKTVTNKKGSYICFGVSWYIFIHVFLNLGGLMALIPLTGVPLPFFSYGGTFTWSLLASLAIVQRIYVENKLKHIKII